MAKLLKVTKIDENENATTTKTGKTASISMEFRESLVEALKNQQLSAHGAIMELLDNAVSNPQKNKRADILLSLTRLSGGEVRVVVADWGRGMTAKQLGESIQYGSDHTGSEGSMCIYGVGLLNALYVLNQGVYPWTILSKTPSGSKYHIIDNPDGKLHTKWELKSDCLPLDLRSILQSSIEQKGRPSTIVSVVSNQGILSTMLTRDGVRAPEKVKDMDTLRAALSEHIGHAYQQLLPQTEDNLEEAEVNITISNFGPEHENIPVLAFNPPYIKTAEPVNLEVEIPGPDRNYKASVTVTSGIIGAGVRNDAVVMGRKPQFYYRHTMATQGYDIHLDGRTVASAQMQSVWGLDKHPAMNDFVGSIDVTMEKGSPRGILGLMNNKSDINRGNEGWQRIFEAIREIPELHPSAVIKTLTNPRFTKAEFVRMLTRSLSEQFREDDVKANVKILHSRTNMDILKVTQGNVCELFLVKQGKATDGDFAKMDHIWNALMVEGYIPDRAFLYCGSVTRSVAADIKQYNKYTEGGEHRFDYRIVEDPRLA